jgi:hypothetical protein
LPLSQQPELANQKIPQLGERIFLSLERSENNSSPSLAEDEEAEDHEEFDEVATSSSSPRTGVVASAHKTAPPLRYTEASFIRELESAGVGRPSTYASIIQTLEDRGYILVDKRTIVPTVKGVVVSNLLAKHFPEIILPEFTSEMESSLDLIAQGALEKNAYLKSFYLGQKTTTAMGAEKGVRNRAKASKEVGSGTGAESVTKEEGQNQGLKSKAIEVNNNKQNFSSYDYKVLDIKNLKKFGRLFYTGDEELILEQRRDENNNNSGEQQKENQNETASVIKRWKLPISGDIRKLSEEYLEETILKKSCENKDYVPRICPEERSAPRLRIPQPGQWIGDWNEKPILLKMGKYGPYLDYDGTFW